MDATCLIRRTTKAFRRLLVAALLLGLSLGGLTGPAARAATPGLPFAEDFSDTDLRDSNLTNANWSTEEQALVLAWRRARYGAFGPGSTGSDVSADARYTLGVALGDVDGDGDLDLVAGDYGQPNRLYLNHGTADPFSGVTGSDIGADDGDTYAVALGDVDGDGDLDLVTGNDGQPNRLYLNNGTEAPFDGVIATDVTLDADSTYGVALGDVDGDGDLDLVAGNSYWDQPNRLYLNNGTTDPFSGVTGSDLSSDAESTYSVALGDVDGDGDLDLVTGNFDEVNRLYLNNGTADPFSGVTGSSVTADAQDTVSVALGDVDGDGDLDLVAGNEDQPNRLYLNNGTVDPFSGVSGSDVTADAQNTVSAALGDVDGDGDMDLVTGNFDEPNRLYLNNGTANPFSGVVGRDVTGDVHYTDAVALGDVDGDGDLDLVAGKYGVNRLFLNDGTPSPFHGVTGSEISTDAQYTLLAALGDVDGDGDLDLVAGNWNHTNRLYLNNGTAAPFSGVSGSDVGADARATRSIALGDVDGDGDLDLVAGNDNQVNQLYLNDGTADPFGGVTGSDVSADVHNTYSVALGDVDRDGDLDLVVGNKYEANRLYPNNGTGAPFNGVTGSEINSDDDDTYSVALGDVDGDGDLDLVAGNDGRNRLYLNNGTGDPFGGVTGSDVSEDTDFTCSVALGDVDGDGDLDLVAGNRAKANRLYLNNGTATPFEGVVGSDVSPDVHNTWSAALGDVDGDGDLDLVAGNSAAQANRLYLNDGTPNPFSGVSGSDVSADSDDTISVALGDVDGDGALDLVAGNDGQANRLYLNAGGPSPTTGWAGSDVSPDTDSTTSAALGDVDGDGDLDLVIGNYNAEVNRLYLNNGTADPFGGVIGSDIGADANWTYSVALGDVDGDGDLDLVTADWGQIRLYLNNGTVDPFGGVAGSDVSADGNNTTVVVLGDMDRDGDLDLVAGNYRHAHRLYLNNGTADPFGGVIGSQIAIDTYDTWSLALGDVDGDGDLDLVSGNRNEQPNRLYLNNGTEDPFGGVSGSSVSADAHKTQSVALGDVDGDGDLDMVAGNWTQTDRLYLNNGTADPFGGVTGSDITLDTHSTRWVALGDVDRDGDLDMVAGIWGRNRLYLNNGTADPFSGVTGSDVSTDGNNTTVVVLGEMDGDGHLDLVDGDGEETIRLYRRVLYHTGQGRAGSLRVDAETAAIEQAMLIPTAGRPPNTGVMYWLSNDGGGRWFIVQPGVMFEFPTVGADLRWRAELRSLSPARTPRVEGIVITAGYEVYLPVVLK